MNAYTVGIYSPGKAFVVYEIRRQVYFYVSKVISGRMEFSRALTLPTAPSPVTTHCYISQSALLSRFGNEASGIIVLTFRDWVAGPDAIFAS